jgi:glycerophosphoryl diester phosphodiesterase
MNFWTNGNRWQSLPGSVQGWLVRHPVRALSLAIILLFTGFAMNFCFNWSPQPLDHLFSGRTRVMAHRGASGLAPENTLAAFRRALADGADTLELDVTLTRDGQVVVIHDSTLDRTTNGSGPVGDLTLSQIKELDAGAWFGPEFAGERVPTLQEVLDLAGADVLLEVELKTLSPWPRSLVNGVVAVIEQNGAERRVIVQSFNPGALFHLERANPQIATGLLYHGGLPLPLRNRWFNALAHPDSMNLGLELATAQHVAMLQGKGYPVVVWTVNEPEDMRRLVALGVDGIMTDRPDLLAQVVLEANR